MPASVWSRGELVVSESLEASSMLRVDDEPKARFQALYVELFADLSGYCNALLRDESLALECAQEAFVRLFARWRGVRDPKGFLFLVATNLARDEWRRQARQRSLVDRLSRRLPEPTIGVDDTSYDLIARLPSKLRDVVVLTYVVDLPLTEVAQTLGLPLGTVKRRLHDARAQLRVAWEDS
jgi:RNA polymerase sigma factor (sigma-70 family)